MFGLHCNLCLSSQFTSVQRDRERWPRFRHHLAARISWHGYSVKELSIELPFSTVSYHITRRIEFNVGQSDGPDDALPAALGRSEGDKEHLVLNVVEAILALKPVTFRYKHELDPDGIPQFGLVAEQVEKVNPDLVVRDADGKINTVRYEAVNAMLLNEFLKEHRKVEITSLNKASI
jgi:Chaperone of endosialidase